MMVGIEDVFTPSPVFLAKRPQAVVATEAQSAPQLDHRVAQLEAIVTVQTCELAELRLALKSVVAALQRIDGDGR